MKLNIPAQFKASVDAKLAEGAATVDITKPITMLFQTGEPMRRTGWGGDYWLQLDLAGADLTLFNSGRAPWLDSHNTDSMRNVVGKVTGAKIVIESNIAYPVPGHKDTLSKPVSIGRALAEVEISDREDLEWFRQDVAAGRASNVSVGLSFIELEELEAADGLPLIIARLWEPLEVSSVYAGANRPARILKQGDVVQLSEETNAPDSGAAIIKEKIMEDDKKLAAPAEPQPDQVQAERARVAEIVKLCSDFNVDSEPHVLSGASIETVRASILETLRAKQAPAQPPATSSASAQPVLEPGAKCEAMAEALAARINRPKDVSPAARQFANWGFADCAAEILGRRGILRTGADKEEVIRLAFNSTSDFPLLLANTANRFLMPAYQTAATTFRQIAAEKSFNDFKAHSFLQVGAFPATELVGEGGEVKSGTIGESGETAYLKSYGKIFPITRQALINDNLGAFADLTGAAGRRVAMDQNTLVYAVLIANAAMSDTVALFNAAHGNLAGTGAAPSDTTLSAARRAMRIQTGIAGDVLNLRPTIILCGPAYETTIQKLLVQITATQTSNVNVFAGSLQLVVDANITGNAWYMFADPSVAPVLVYGSLSGQTGPMVETQNGFEIAGVKFKVTYDFGVGVVDYRGGYLNPGA